MHDSKISTVTDQPALVALVDLVAATHESGALMVSATRLVDALLDVRSGADHAGIEAVDRALSGLGYRSVVTTEEALEVVASITAADRSSAPAIG